jgi:hypothetical protein
MKTSDWTRSLVFADHRTGIRMGCQDYRPIGSLQRAIKGGYVIGQERQRDRGRHDIEPLGLQGRDNVVPARTVSPGAMDQHNTGPSIRTPHAASFQEIGF